MLMFQCRKCKEWKDESDFTLIRPKRQRDYLCYCKTCVAKLTGERRMKLRAGGLCVTCGCEKNNSFTRCNSCRERMNKTTKERRKILKLMAFEAYGGLLCACCGETNIEFLCIDHINGGGYQHRKEIGGVGATLYLWLKKNNYPKGYRVLCANCNTSQGIYGYCPHEQKIDFFNLKVENGVVVGAGGR